MSNVLTIEGKPRDFEAVTPGAVGFFFGSNSYLMNIQPSNNIEGVTESTIAVRLDTFFRCPTISNMNVTIYGAFDNDRIFRANYLEVAETRLSICGVRRFTPIVGLALLLVVPSVVYLLVYLIGPWVEEKATGLVLSLAVNETIAGVFGASLGLIVIFLIVTPPFIFLTRTALPSVLEGLGRLAGRLACYRAKPISSAKRDDAARVK
ncbi:hypothetical protein J2797_006241 [Paraburkholderia terricola]|uniref:hypothetical protein n=1 Tax=Paraburkholderia terricola TaxID=169427 RepID=UPI00285CF4C5|nr:hypothetical protein [Paraburkholderia terricola]MDR6496314.1 hypothetical protein [Paraburkholderia terricola]